jgi:hypothetical protein
MGINKLQLVALPFGILNDQIVDMVNNSANGGHWFLCIKQHPFLQLPTSFMHLEVKVQVFEVLNQHSL